MTHNSDPIDHVPDYKYNCSIENIIDGDTLDVLIDLGFETRLIKRVRLKGVDTAEIHFQDKESEEYERGMEQTRFVEAFAEETTDAKWSFIIHSVEYERGKYGRVVADIWSKEREAWLTEQLIKKWPEVAD